MNDLPSRLALHRCNLPADKLLDLLAKYTHAERILSASSSQLSELGLGKDAISRLQNPDMAGVERDLAWLDKPNHRILFIDDDHYPARLKSISDPPYALFVLGDADYLQQPQLAMVGSRTPTAAGRRTAEEFSRHLSTAGLTITSGLARGIDGASHEGALQGIAGTVAVIANGLNRIYPPGHVQLAERISREGCIVSESPIGTAPHKGLFPRRNRIISGLSIGTLVVEAAKNSGSLITARHAMEQNREVFAIPGSIHNPLARGCHSLIRQGAKLVETADDILEELSTLVNLSASRHTSTQFTQAEAESTLDPAYENLLNCMEYEPASIDDLVERSKLNAAEIASMLLILELQGYVISEHGRYSRTGSKA
ncbi:MAG: DNA-protecting protein DprA [Gammaproteobacteria bacterium]|nr:MAG: DNA-protecting protein DprA [Gammaproteobacteria bacterium]